MLKRWLVLFLFISGFSTSYSQYLEFKDFKNLCELAKDKAKADTFLKAKGFTFSDMEYLLENYDDENDTTGYKANYNMKLNKDEYNLQIFGDPYHQSYTASETSSNIDRWNYFTTVIENMDLKPDNTQSWDVGKDTEGWNFKDGDYQYSLYKYPDKDSTMQYSFMMFHSSR